MDALYPGETAELHSWFTSHLPGLGAHSPASSPSLFNPSRLKIQIFLQAGPVAPVCLSPCGAGSPPPSSPEKSNSSLFFLL